MIWPGPVPRDRDFTGTCERAETLGLNTGSEYPKVLVDHFRPGTSFILPDRNDVREDGLDVLDFLAKRVPELTLFVGTSSGGFLAGDQACGDAGALFCWAMGIQTKKVCAHEGSSYLLPTSRP